MSRDLGFDDLPETEKSDSEPYIPGGPVPNLQLIVNLVQEFTSDDSIDRVENYPGSLTCECIGGRMQEFIESRIDEEFDHNEFLDNLISYAAETGLFADGYLGEYLNTYLLDPLVQALFNLGYNDFKMDMSIAMITDNIFCVGFGLDGKEDKRLQLSTNGAYLCELGTSSVWTEITHHGDTTSIGHDGYHSTYHVIGKVELRYIGFGASESEFYVNPDNIYWHGEDENLSPSGREYFILDYLKKEHEFWRRKKPGSKVKMEKTNNHLYFPDDEEGWREVLP